ncbi:MAG: NCS2 family permease, partial [Clostridiales bacterium]|nr:NCS2 family permease [Clostridiales bacterium]
AIPHNIKYAVTAGIGLFIAFMGMQKCHMVVADGHHLVKFVEFAGLSDYNTMSTILCILGLVLIAVLHYKHVHGAILIGKILVIIAAIPLGLYHHGEINLFAYDFGAILPTAFKMDFTGFLSHGGSLGMAGGLIAAGAIVITLCIMDVFETMSTVIATDHILDHKVHHDETNEKIKKTLEADAIATVVGSSMGVTTVSTFVESTAMAVEGGRTGLSGVVTSFLFILAIFIAPFASVIPSAATATTLIITGVFMMSVVKQINFHDVEEGLPAFFTMAFIPLTYSLINGISLGLVTHTFICIFSGRAKEVKKGTYLMTLLFVLMFIFM